MHDSPCPLTPRQLEIAGLVRQGFTNKQIARRLVLADPTVANHVHQAPRRLQVPSPGQPARWMVRGTIEAVPTSPGLTIHWSHFLCRRARSAREAAIEIRAESRSLRRIATEMRSAHPGER